MAFLVEVVVNGAANGGEFLQTLHPPEAEHRPLPSSNRLMRILRRVVQPAAGLALAQTVIAQLPKWFEHYNTVHPHSALGYRAPREFINERSKREALSET